MSLYVSTNLRSSKIKPADYFNYEPLEDATRDIRLIGLLPGKVDDQLRVEMLHSSPTEPEQDHKRRPSQSDIQKILPAGETPRVLEPSFEALSYVWGSQDDPQEVTVVPHHATTGSALNPGGVLLVGRSLSLALRHLRREEEARTLWIDALCINQDDNAEREKQVRRMGDVYRLAQRVIVWLGPAAADTTLALSTLEHLGSQVEVTLDGAKVASPGAEHPTWCDEAVDLPYSAATWKAIHDLLDRRWFRRLWVIQEVALANSLAVVQCGDDVMRFNLFRRAVTCLYSKNNLPYAGLRQLVLEAVRISEDHRDKTLMSLMENSRRQQCLDPKDKIYGMLGMAPLGFAKRIHPNYADGVTVEDVYLDFFLHHLHHFGRWELFACEMSDRKIGGPSWVPDWTSPDVPGWGSRQQFSAGHSKIHFTYRAPNLLEVTGLRAATVSRVNDPVVSNDPGIDLMTVRTWEPGDLQGRSYVAGGSLLDAYAVTLLQHRIRDRWPKNSYMPTLEEWKSQTAVPAEFGERAKPGHSVDRFDRSISLSNRAYNCVLRRALFSTEEGYLGLGPVATQPGCDPPVVLRPRPDGTFQLVGYCFVYGLHDATALLGPLPHPWQVQLWRYEKSMFREVYRFFNPDTGEVTADDPRLEPDPVWERVGAESLGRDLGPDDPAICEFFRNTETGEVVDYDPRLLPEALEKMLRTNGKKLETFALV
ncbi:hypothetical protein MAPG_11558 [Magnaporthiopsis poae ATCC 64411]|uniref:Heterokaryon incompatibility domain-containing protein n=1 Tax=Magnaporthiopsis poae (strain ATCC 64411 / 73-15) TaxID=644358 RepID=A0A0C4EFK7_MAGP6|nr:hypothetical protein MAPG_11558 [Magnaporthiopsis poae ATCC 64411]